MLWLAAGGRCQLCGEALPDDWHADHLTPWIVSGVTNIFDMQALCPPCNLRKGRKMALSDNVMKAHELCDRIAYFAGLLRKPQREALALLREIATGIGGGAFPYLTSPGHLVAEVVPGGGKSFIAVMACSVLVGSGLFDVAVWLTPRTTLLEQAKEDFADTSIARKHLQKKISIFNPAGLIPHRLKSNRQQELLDPQHKVWVVPYQQLDSVVFMLSQLAESKRTLLIFDEFQLMSDLSRSEHRLDPDGWFKSLAPLVTTCVEKTGFGGVILSGRLSRNDRKWLPLVGYRQGDIGRGEKPDRRYPLWDVAYSLSEAQADKSIIKMDFDFYNGEVEFECDSAQQLESLEKLTSKNYDAKLKQFLSEPEVWQPIIDDMLESLDFYNPPPGHGHRARYIVISKSIADAQAHTKYLENIGRKPLLIHSQLPGQEKKHLQTFRRGEGEWDGLTSVAIPYIGLSVPSLSHMAYLSHYRSAEWIEQAFHRITRMDSHPSAPPYERQLARIFLPNDPVMRDLVQQIMACQNPGVLALPRPPGTFHGGAAESTLEYEAIRASISRREFNTNGEACSKHDFIESALREVPELNAISRRSVEKLKEFADNWKG